MSTEQKEAMVVVRITTAEKLAWERAAAEADRTLSGWVRHAGNNLVAKKRVRK